MTDTKSKKINPPKEPEGIGPNSRANARRSDPGLILSGDGEATPLFLEALGRQRHFEREAPPRV